MKREHRWRETGNEIINKQTLYLQGIYYFVNLRTSEIHLFYNLQLFYWHFLEILWLFIFLIFYNLFFVVHLLVSLLSCRCCSPSITHQHLLSSHMYLSTSCSRSLRSLMPSCHSHMVSPLIHHLITFPHSLLSFVHFILWLFSRCSERM